MANSMTTLFAMASLAIAACGDVTPRPASSRSSGNGGSDPAGGTGGTALSDSVNNRVLRVE